MKQAAPVSLRITKDVTNEYTFSLILVICRVDEHIKNVTNEYTLSLILVICRVEEHIKNVTNEYTFSLTLVIYRVEEHIIKNVTNEYTSSLIFQHTDRENHNMEWNNIPVLNKHQNTFFHEIPRSLPYVGNTE